LVPCPSSRNIPITLFLATQDADGGNTGKMYDVMAWNVEHGLGGHERWQDTSFSYETLRAQVV
jgi:hypothetical protein